MNNKLKETLNQIETYMSTRRMGEDLSSIDYDNLEIDIFSQLDYLIDTKLIKSYSIKNADSRGMFEVTIVPYE